jgi:hypothetical protein
MWEMRNLKVFKTQEFTFQLSFVERTKARSCHYPLKGFCSTNPLK